MQKRSVFQGFQVHAQHSESRFILDQLFVPHAAEDREEPILLSFCDAENVGHVVIQLGDYSFKTGFFSLIFSYSPTCRVPHFPQ